MSTKSTLPGSSKNRVVGNSYNQQKELERVRRERDLLRKQLKDMTLERGRLANLSLFSKNNSSETSAQAKHNIQKKHGVKAHWNVDFSLFDREIFRKLYSVDYELQSKWY